MTTTSRKAALRARQMQAAFAHLDDADLQYSFDHLRDDAGRCVKSGKNKGQLKQIWVRYADDILIELRRRRNLFAHLQDAQRAMKVTAYRCLADRVSAVLDSARVNADDTVYLEKAAPEADYNVIAIESIRSLLSDREYSNDKRLVTWFAQRGIQA